jgi:hypothetical protein
LMAGLRAERAPNKPQGHPGRVEIATAYHWREYAQRLLAC